jgi:hypothetical protein
MIFNLRECSQARAPLQASKWLYCPLLIDLEEMKNLFKTLGPFYLVLASGVTKEGEGFITHEQFLDCYAVYIEALKAGSLPDDSRIRPYFTSVLTCSLDPLYRVPLADRQQLIKIDKPVIQLQGHKFNYSTADGKFRSMVFGQASIFWGIQFSYPQLYQDENFVVKAVKEGDEFPNTALFKKLQKWVRVNTVPTPFIVDGKQINVPFRLGKSCFTWINNHPQLIKNQLIVKT